MIAILSSNRSRHAWIALALGVLLFMVYMLGFSGMFRSDDEQFIIDTTDSFTVRTGPDRLLLNETVYLRGLQTTDVEPAQPILAVPLYWLAYQIPWIGNVHAIYLFNPAITALTAMLVFAFALELGYRERTALAAALLFGLTTIAVPYTKTFFREPLTTLNLLAAAFCLDRWRHAFQAHEHRHWKWLAIGIFTVVLALLSKEATLIALPVLLLMAYPGGAILASRRREIFIIAAVLAILITGLALGVVFYREQWEAVTGRYEVLARLSDFAEGLPKAWYPTLGYLFSPAKGVFWYSPVLMMSLAAPLVAGRSRWREAWLPLILALAFALVYGAIRQELWHGGAGWGARYMLPLTPFLMLGALPLLDRILSARRRLPCVLLGGLALCGLLVQAGGLYVNVHEYYGYQQMATGLTPWNDAIIWSVRWSQALGSLLFLPLATPDIVWLWPRADLVSLFVVAISITAAAIWLTRLRLQGDLSHRSRLVTGSLPLLTAGATLILLARAYPDPRFEGHNQDLHALRADLLARAGPDDVIFLTTPHYVPHFMNYFKGRTLWYSLPLSPGERYSCEHIPDVLSHKLDEQIDPVSVSMIGRVQQQNPVGWLVSDNGPLVPCATRPVEHFVATAAFPAGAVDYTPLVRLVQYVPLRAPSADAPPANPSTARFGSSIRLVGYDLVMNKPQASLDRLQPGAGLGVSLLWRSGSAIEADYTFAVYLINEAGQVVLQQDRAPVMGFAPTSQWQPGEPIRDNYGFILPETLPPGEYQIWVVIYSWPSLERLPVSVSGSDLVQDHLVLRTLQIHRSP